MAVTFADLEAAVKLVCEAAFFELAGISPQTHGCAHLLDLALLFHQSHHGIRRLLIEFHAVGPRHSADMACVLHHRHLKPQTNPEKRNLVFACGLHRTDLALCSALSKPPRNQDPI